MSFVGKYISEKKLKELGVTVEDIEEIENLFNEFDEAITGESR